MDVILRRAFVCLPCQRLVQCVFNQQLFSLCGCNQVLDWSHWLLFSSESCFSKSGVCPGWLALISWGKHWTAGGLFGRTEDGEALTGCLCLWEFCQDAAPALRLLSFLPASC